MLRQMPDGLVSDQVPGTSSTVNVGRSGRSRYLAGHDGGESGVGSSCMN